MRNSRLVATVTSLAIAFVALPTEGQALTAEEKNYSAALHSFNFAGMLLAMHYGVDPTFPSITLAGGLTTTNFGWTAAGSYFGSDVAWSAAGSYDSVGDTLHWSGSGSYAGSPWSLDGDIRWLSPTSFEIAEQYWIGLTPGDDGLITDGWNEGSVQKGSVLVDIGLKLGEYKSKVWAPRIGNALLLWQTFESSYGLGSRFGEASGWTEIVTTGECHSGAIDWKYVFTGTAKIPEPSTFALSVLGAVALLIRRRK